MALRDIFWHAIPPTRVGVFSGRIKCPCEPQFWDTLEMFFPGGAGKTLVDVGCGPGIKSLTLALTGVQVLGFDMRESCIQHAQENARQIREKYPKQRIQAEFHQKDIQTGLSELPDNSVDIVLFVEVIEHLKRYEIVLAEILRILKPSGMVFITTPNKTLHQKEQDEQVYGEKAFGHVCEFDREELLATAKEAGFNVAHAGYINSKASGSLCRWIHPWMIRDHGFLQHKAHIDDVIGIRTLSFLQPLYNTGFPVISAIIEGYNRLAFPLLHHLVRSKAKICDGKTLFLVGIKAAEE